MVVIVGFHCFIVKSRRHGELPLILAQLVENNSSVLTPWPSPLICKIICRRSSELVSISIERVNEETMSSLKLY